VVVGTARHIDGMSLEFGYCQCGKQSTTGKQSAGRQQATNKEEFFMLESEASEAVEGWGGLWNSWGPGVLCPILSGTGQRLYENFKKKGLSSKMRFA